MDILDGPEMPADGYRGEASIDDGLDVFGELLASPASRDVDNEKLVDGIDGDELSRILIVWHELLRPVQFPVVQQQGDDDALFK
ncbi:hypothetical protein LCGC14_1680940, partial [marine sediment metagenome]